MRNLKRCNQTCEIQYILANFNIFQIRPWGKQYEGTRLLKLMFYLEGNQKSISANHIKTTD